MAKQTKTIATRPDDLSSIPRPHTEKAQDWLPQIVLWCPNTCVYMDSTIFKSNKNPLYKQI